MRLTAIAATCAALSLTAAIPAAAAPSTESGDLQPVASLDLARYTGTWNQLAAIPQIFSAQCVANTQAEYAPAGPGVISVKNSCDTWWGTRSVIEGTATVRDTVTNAQLTVNFPSVPVQSEDVNYVVAHIADDYSWALVGSPDRSSGFVLTRGVALTNAQWVHVKNVTAANGFDTCAFWKTPTTGGDILPTPLCWAH